MQERTFSRDWHGSDVQNSGFMPKVLSPDQEQLMSDAIRDHQHSTAKEKSTGQRSGRTTEVAAAHDGTQSSQKPSSYHELHSHQACPVDSGNRQQPSLDSVLATSSPLIRRRPRMSDLNQSEKSPELQNTVPTPVLPKPRRRPIVKRRCMSANATVDAHTRFSSPDRYISSRTSFHEGNTSYRVSKPPKTLQGRELYFRRRDDSTNPFRSLSESRSRVTVEKCLAINSNRSQPPHYVPSFVNGTNASPVHVNLWTGIHSIRQISIGGFWNVGGRGGVHHGQSNLVPSGSGELLASGFNALVHTPGFLDQPTLDDKVRGHEIRLALALDIDQTSRVLATDTTTGSKKPYQIEERGRTIWRDGAWIRGNGSGPNSSKKKPQITPEKAMPTVAFRVLDAPHLKDDYYCSILAYSQSSHTLAVALTHRVYLWTEQHGVRYPPLPPVRSEDFVTSLAFSSDQGGKSILAVARHSGIVTLWSLLEPRPRFEVPHSCAASAIAFRPHTTLRLSTDWDTFADCEDLIIGDDSGHVHYYSVEWPGFAPGSMSLIARLDAHVQNICGLAWSSDGENFVTGGNDNVALLFNADKVIQNQDLHGDYYTTAPAQQYVSASGPELTADASGYTSVQAQTPPPRRNVDGLLGTTERSPMRENILESLGLQTPPSTPRHVPDRQRPSPETPIRRPDARHMTPPDSSRPDFSHRGSGFTTPRIISQTDAHVFCFRHSAAVKALAFAPWQPSLLATGGGSNDRQIHFHHTGSGATLAVIHVFAQVTSLTWSTTRREIAATFGYAQPEHDIRVAVFSWPSCECVVSIPWEKASNGEVGRALWAIAYPGGPNDAVPTRRQPETEGFAAWETVRLQTARNRREHERNGQRNGSVPEPAHRGRSATQNATAAPRSERSMPRTELRGEGETWASRTQEEGSLIIACCDQTVKFFEVWAGKSKGKGFGLGMKEGVLGGSRVLEGWCEGIGIDEIGFGGDTIR